MTARDCPDAARCPVPEPDRAVDPTLLSIAPLPANDVVCRAFEFRFGYDSFNPGLGDTRFAPLMRNPEPPIPTLYGGTDDLGVLLESVLHDVHQDVPDRVIYEAIVRGFGLAYMRLPRVLALVDFRNAALERYGLSRGQIVSTTAEHYSCTREWAMWLHGLSIGGVQPDGILWHSRQAELLKADRLSEVFVLFGDRAESSPGAYPLTHVGVRNLTEGPGLVMLESLAEQLDARIEPAID